MVLAQLDWKSVLFWNWKYLIRPQVVSKVGSLHNILRKTRLTSSYIICPLYYRHKHFESSKFALSPSLISINSFELFILASTILMNLTKFQTLTFAFCVSLSLEALNVFMFMPEDCGKKVSNINIVFSTGLSTQTIIALFMIYYFKTSPFA